MLVCGFELTARQVFDFADDMDSWCAFLASHGIAWNQREHVTAIRRAYGNVSAADVHRFRAPTGPRRDRGLRRDVANLVAFVDSGGEVPPRIRDVFERCIRGGMTIDVCARELGVGRETVRTHLRRLREIVQLAS